MNKHLTLKKNSQALEDYLWDRLGRLKAHWKGQKEGRRWRGVCGKGPDLLLLQQQRPHIKVVTDPFRYITIVVSLKGEKSQF